MTYPNLTQAMADRDRGMAQALGAAERAEPSWGDMAYEALRLYVAGGELSHGQRFTSYHFIAACKYNRFPIPTTPKAFGAIFTKAARDGLIRKVGYVPHPLRNASPTVLWEVV